MLIYKLLSARIVKALAAALPLLLGGCIGLVPSPFRPSPGPQTTPQIYDLAEAFDIVCRNYRLGPEDQLEAFFAVRPADQIQGPYKVSPSDRLAIKFILDPQLNEDVVVRPDGMITLQAIGDVRAGELTPEQLAQKIEQKFIDANIFSREQTPRDFRNYRLVTVHVISFQQQGAGLIESLKNLVGGTRTAVIVKPDGTIDLPWLKDRILCAGHTLPDVERTADRLFKEMTDGQAMVSLTLAKAVSRKVYILGEVSSPGAYSISQPITALHALALAGGHKSDTADLTSVILISRNAQGKPFGRRLDLKRILDVGDMGAAILVKPYDVLYIPKTYVRDLRLFMEQYVATIADFGNLVNVLRDNNDD